MPFPTYDKKDAIPAGAEDVYEEKDGKWHPKVPDTSTLETTLQKERSDRKAAEKAARDAEAAKAAAERERDTYKAQVGDPDQRVADLLKKYDADVAAAKKESDARAEAAEARVRTLTLDADAKKAFVDAGGRPEKADAAVRHYKDRLDLSDDRHVVKDERGQVTTRTLADFFREDVKKEMPEWYTGTKAGGGGASGFNGGATGAGAAPTFEELMANPARGLEAANTTTTTT